MSKQPAGWREFELRDLIAKKFTGPSPTCEERNIASDEEWGLLKTTAVVWEGWNENAHKVPPRTYWGNSSIEVQSGDVLVTKAGPRNRVGVVVHVRETRPHLMVSGKMVGLRPSRHRVLPTILAGLLSSQDAQDYLNSRTTGMAESQTNFSDDALLSTRLLVPPIREQQRLASILDALDIEIRTRARVVSKMASIRRGVLEDAFSSIPPSDYQPLGQLCTADICYGIVQPGPYVAEGISVLAIRDLLGDFETGVHRASRSLDHQYRRSRVVPGDVLLSIKGTIGRVAVVPGHYDGNISRDMARLRFGPAVDPAFARSYFESELGQRSLALSVVGTTRAEVSIHVLKRFRLPVPRLAIQHKVAESLEGFDHAYATEVSSLHKLRSVRVGLMSDLLTGRVPVPAEVAS